MAAPAARPCLRGVPPRGPLSGLQEKAMTPVIAVTSGEPAGIGPDLCLALAGRDLGARIVVIGDAAMLQQRAELLRLPVVIAPYRPELHAPAGALEVVSIPLEQPCVPG